MTSDRDLVTRIVARGDERAFRELYARHSSALYGLSRRLCGYDEEWAEEVLQQAWVRALDALAGFRWEAAFRTWMSGIVVNCAREDRRRLRRTESVRASSVATPPATDPTLRVTLERALADLPHGYRQVIVLYDVEGFAHQEIADMLGIGVGTSKSQLSRARAAMRRLLEGTGEDPRRGCDDALPEAVARPAPGQEKTW